MHDGFDGRCFSCVMQGYAGQGGSQIAGGDAGVRLNPWDPLNSAGTFGMGGIGVYGGGGGGNCVEFIN